MTSVRFAEIAHDLRERIAVGDVAGSGAVESEAELSRRYDVSRPTVRRALELLRREGLVESRQGAGWFVTGTAFHQRLALGTFRHAQSAITAAGKTIERRVVEFGYRPARDSLTAALQVATGTELLHARSVRLVDGVGLDVVREWVRPDIGSSISRDDATDPGIWETLVRQGHRIATVRQTISAGTASESDAQLVGITVGTPLLLIRRLALSDGQPLALSDHRYLAHRFALEVEFNSGPGSASPEPPGLRTFDDQQLEESTA